MLLSQDSESYSLNLTVSGLSVLKVHVIFNEEREELREKKQCSSDGS